MLFDNPNDVPIDGITPSRRAPPGYIKANPQTKYIMQAIEYKPRFLVTISAAFFFLIIPASSIVKPAAIHITKAPAITA